MMRFIAVIFAVLMAAVAVAQQAPEPIDYDAWAEVATRAEGAIEAARASDAAFSDLRAEVGSWRQRFQQQLTVNQSRLDTLNGQLEALGPIPEEGQSEAPELIERRQELTDQIERLTTPRRKAEEAFSRGNGIISEIDRIVRARQAEKLLNAGPIPVNPVLWPAALADLGDTYVAMAAGIRSAFATPSRLKAAGDNLPLVLLLLIGGMVLLVRGRIWSERLTLRILANNRTGSSELAAFFVSLGQILFPVLGAMGVILAVATTELYGPRGGVLVFAVIPSVVLIFGARWLGGRIFVKANNARTPLGISSESRRGGRTVTTLMGAVLALRMILERFDELENYSPDTDAVAAFPLIVIGGICLLFIGRLLRRHDPTLSAHGNDQAYRHRVIRVTGRAAQVLGVIGPVLAAAGFLVAAEAIVFPSIMTLALFAAVAILQDVIRNIYGMFMPGDQDGEGLIPTLLGFLLMLCALPILSLFWGARVTDLTELWTNVRTGIVIGDTTISPTALFTLGLVFLLGYFATRALQGALRTSVLPKTRIDPGGQTALVSGVGYVGIFLSALVAVTSAGLDLSSLAIVAGALSVGIGFGLQNIVSNFVSGIILLIERPISEGDWIEVGGQQGYVRKVSVRSTRIETFDRSDVIVPNADLVSGTVTNFTRGNTVGRAIISVGVAYGTDTRRVEAILREIAEAHPMVVVNPPPSIVFAGFGASSLDFEIRAILRDVNFMLSVKTEMHHQIAERFTAENIEIPFAQTDLWLRNPETLRAAPPDATSADS